MFGYCTNLKEIDVTGFNTENAEDMSSMFSGCESVTELDVSSFNTEKVTDMSSMFSCKLLTKLDVSGFDTAKVTDMGCMFGWCENLSELNLSGLNTSKVTDMKDMFKRCRKLAEIDVSGFNTENVTDMSDMFTTCVSLTELDLSNFDTSNVTNMNHMFSVCAGLKKLNVSSFNTENVVNMNGIFSLTENLDTLALGEKSIFTQNPPGEKWTRYSTLDGAAANAPTYANLSDYDGSAPGWYSAAVVHEIIPTIIFSQSTFTYSGKTQRPVVTVKDGETTLTEGKDYTVTWPETSINAGMYRVTVVLKGSYSGMASKKYKIAPKTITPAVTLTPATVIYNGKVRKPAVTVKSGKTKFAASNYTVTYAAGRKNPGAYKITVKMKGNYSGTRTVSFKINPKGTALVSLTPASKKMIVKWKKQTTQTTGYQIQYATDSKFTRNRKTVTVKGAAAVSKTITKLTGGKKYYVRIRTYKTVNKVNYYSPWSAVKAATVKR